MNRTYYGLLVGILSLTLIISVNGKLHAQTEISKNIRINGLGRTLLQSTNLKGEIAEQDTTTAKDLLDGEFLLDLQLNATPNKQTEVQTIIRLRNELGGFFGAGMSVEVRELFARGVVADVFRYRVGDMDLKMTPFTLYQYQQEGTVHQAEIFKARQEVIDYEQFYKGDGTRRMQGGKFDFGLSAGALLSEINVTGFFTRIRGTDFFTLPTRLVGGGSIELVNPRWGTITGNYINTFDALTIGDFDSGIRNPVQTLTANIHLLDKEKFKLSFLGEIGQSRIYEVGKDEPFDRDDTFAEGSLALNLPQKRVKFQLGFRDVGPDFFSMGAQSKRVDFSRNKTFYQRFGNERTVRQSSLFDINRDRNLYTFGLSEFLLPYDPRFGNTQPYGKATHNRRGVFTAINYLSKDSTLDLGLDYMWMSEIRGQGTFELKNFNLVRAWGDIHFHKLMQQEKILTLTLGGQYETTNRGGNDVQQIDLSSLLLETGVQVELFENFDLLLGLKQLTAEGSDYIPQIVNFNEVRDFPPRYVVDDSEQMLAGGIRYRFKEGIYLSAQWERFSFSRATEPAHDYQINQIFILYNMNF